ncbi:hypothetical protein E3A20_09890 [Planctomyces bekefii]|uniref:Cytochrome oxidase subunit II copper A binding domain-containing protein n=1 Tax=Planctomyces bekefii TaxID=1653850 RepID=A0A5C6M710_9PLAN|nr:hypothetical protein E3A20_09890 [Planctomyces bekefii]
MHREQHRVKLRPDLTTLPLLCAELCGWGHYKMKARIIAESPEGVSAYLTRLEREQNEDGVQEAETASVE